MVRRAPRRDQGAARRAAAGVRGHPGAGDRAAARRARRGRGRASRTTSGRRRGRPDRVARRWSTVHLMSDDGRRRSRSASLNEWEREVVETELARPTSRRLVPQPVRASRRLARRRLPRRRSATGARCTPTSCSSTRSTARSSAVDRRPARPPPRRLADQAAGAREVRRRVTGRSSTASRRSPKIDGKMRVLDLQDERVRAGDSGQRQGAAGAVRQRPRRRLRRFKCLTHGPPRRRTAAGGQNGVPLYVPHRREIGAEPEPADPLIRRW